MKASFEVLCHPVNRRLEDIQPAAGKAWVPYISWQGPVNSSQLTRVMSHAVEVWVPTTFHRAALLRAGAPAAKVLRSLLLVVCMLQLCAKLGNLRAPCAASSSYPPACLRL